MPQRRENAGKAASELGAIADRELDRADLERIASNVPENEANHEVAGDQSHADGELSRRTRIGGGKPGSIERRDVEKSEERQAEIQRALNTEFAIGAEPDNDIELD